ncbi:hypothetical protein V1506DRAFT_279895 [Lipomyces tetrasporus]
MGRNSVLCTRALLSQTRVCLGSRDPISRIHLSLLLLLLLLLLPGLVQNWTPHSAGVAAYSRSVPCRFPVARFSAASMRRSTAVSSRACRRRVRSLLPCKWRQCHRMSPHMCIFPATAVTVTPTTEHISDSGQSGEHPHRKNPSDSFPLSDRV